MLVERDEDILNEATIADRLIHRDGLMLILDKPAGIPVHHGPKGGANLEALFSGLRFGLPRNPALAHRLDRDTSGCLVLGRHRKALEKLGILFKQGKVEKTYWAVVEGAPEDDEGLIDLPLGRRDATRGWWMKVDAQGLPSRTRYKVMARDGGRAALALAPLTGRTHQLRVHCAAMGWPILGDPIYGTGGSPLHLHARAIRVPLAKAKPPVEAEAPLPPHMREAWLALGLSMASPPASNVETSVSVERGTEDRHEGDIEGTAEGGRRGAVRQARRDQEEGPQRRIEVDG